MLLVEAGNLMRVYFLPGCFVAMDRIFSFFFFLFQSHYTIVSQPTYAEQMEGLIVGPDHLIERKKFQPILGRSNHRGRPATSSFHFDTIRLPSLCPCLPINTR